MTFSSLQIKLVKNISMLYTFFMDDTQSLILR